MARFIRAIHVFYVRSMDGEPESLVELQFHVIEFDFKCVAVK